MRLTLRFLIPLLIALALFAYAAVPLVDTLTTRWFVRDLDIRSQPHRQHGAGAARGDDQGRRPRADLRASSSASPRTSACTRSGLCLSSDAMPIATGAFPGELRCSGLAPYMNVGEHLLRTAKGVVHVAVRRIDGETPDSADLVLVHDMSFIERRSEETRRYLFYFFAALAASVALITVVIAQLSWRGWVAGLRALLRGEGILRPVVEHRAGAAADRARRAGAPARARAPVPADRRDPAALDAGHAARGAARRDARQRRHHRQQPRAVHPRQDARTASACSIRRAASSPRSSRSCAPARAPGSRTAAAAPIARPSTSTIASASRPRSRPTASAACG